jgi:hypothetical protein
MAKGEGMQADFLDAHERHWADAEHLSQAGRWANADHHYGIAAECGLKRLMLAFGMPYDLTKDHPQERDDRVHADGIWARFESYRSGHTLGAGYILATTSNPFDNWHISDRYANRSNFNEARVLAHQSGAQAVIQLVKTAQYAGLL